MAHHSALVLVYHLAAQLVGCWAAEKAAWWAPQMVERMESQSEQEPVGTRAVLMAELTADTSGARRVPWWAAQWAGLLVDDLGVCWADLSVLLWDCLPAACSAAWWVAARVETLDDLWAER